MILPWGKISSRPRCSCAFIQIFAQDCQGDIILETMATRNLAFLGFPQGCDVSCRTHGSSRRGGYLCDCNKPGASQARKLLKTRYLGCATNYPY